MKPKLGLLEPLETRTIRHASHMIDIDAHPLLGDFLSLRWDANTFPFKISHFLSNRKISGVVLYPQFEEELKDPLRDIIYSLQEQYPSVSLHGFRPSCFDDIWDYNYGRADQNIRLYQEPLAPEDYAHKLKRFRKAGFTYRQLGIGDIPALMGLVAGWVMEKRRTILSGLPEGIPSESELLKALRPLKEEAYRALEVFQIRDGPLSTSSLISTRRDIETLEAYRIALNLLLESERTDEGDYERMMGNPLTMFYGAFRDGQLAAYVHTIGNDSFKLFSSRAGIRVNTYSPQEFLDLSVAKEFVERGARMFDRGEYAQRKGIEGLADYKRKFGPMTAVIEMNYHNAFIYRSTQLEHLAKRFRIER